LLDAGGGSLDLNDVHLLKVGRHFRLDAATKAVVGRVERENATIVTFSRPTDLLLTTRDAPGPTTLLRGDLSPEHIAAAGALTARYSKLRESPRVVIEVTAGRRPSAGSGRPEQVEGRGRREPEAIEVAPIADAAAQSLRIE
jgi:hypothetical protein